METLQALSRRVEETRPGTMDRLLTASGWRGLFDPLACEWNSAPIDEKAAIIRVFLEFVDFPTLIEMYAQMERREYVLMELPSAIFSYRKLLPEANEYFHNHERCRKSPYYSFYRELEDLGATHDRNGMVTFDFDK